MRKVLFCVFHFDGDFLGWRVLELGMSGEVRSEVFWVDWR